MFKLAIDMKVDKVVAKYMCVNDFKNGVSNCIEYVLYNQDNEILVFKTMFEKNDNLLEELEKNGIGFEDYDKVMVSSRETLIYENKIEIDLLKVEQEENLYNLIFLKQDRVKRILVPVLMSYVRISELSNVIIQLCAEDKG